jgi:glycosyltransferase involved in cell wall biosynthesis
VLTVSEPVKKHLLVDQHGIEAEKIDVIANFADDELFAYRPAPPLERPIRMVFHGTVLERYGLRSAMHAFAKVRDRGALRLTIIGEGDFSEALKALIAELNIDDMVTFQNRMYPLHEMPSRLASFHMGFVPMEISSVTDYALPLKLLEYTALGMPSIAVRNVAVSHYFGEEDCLFYEPSDPGSLADVLNRVADDPAVVVNCERRVVAIRESLAWSGQSEKYGALLRRLAG